MVQSLLLMLMYVFGSMRPRYSYQTERGQGLVVYALILMLVAIAVVATLSLIGPQLQEMFNQTADAVAEKLYEFSLGATPKAFGDIRHHRLR